MMDINKENKSDLRFEYEDNAVWVFSGDSQQGTEISHLITSHIDDYNEDDVRLICHFAANEIERLRAKLAKAAHEGFVLVPREPTPKMIDSTWDMEEQISWASHNMRNEIIYKAMIEAQEQSHD